MNPSRPESESRLPKVVWQGKEELLVHLRIRGVQRIWLERLGEFRGREGSQRFGFSVKRRGEINVSEVLVVDVLLEKFFAITPELRNDLVVLIVRGPLHPRRSHQQEGINHREPADDENHVDGREREQPARAFASDL